MSELVFHSGTMGSGKSGQIQQRHRNYQDADAVGFCMTMQDRSGPGIISSRIYPDARLTAHEVTKRLNIYTLAQHECSVNNGRLDYIICDEVQFYTARQIEQLFRVMDELDVNVYAYGLMADFRGKLFPGSASLLALGATHRPIEPPALCWCGSKATHNARIVDGVMVTTGEQVVVGDVNTEAAIKYRVLCRVHYRAHQPVSPST